MALLRVVHPEWALGRRFCLDLAGDDVVFISGSGRSGTSWLANICNYRNDFRYMFEPLNPHWLEKPNEKIRWLIPVDEQNELLTRIFRGRVSNGWVNSRNRRLIAGRRMVKEIRANLNIVWVRRNFPQTKIVLALRNPMAVAASRKRLSRVDVEGRWDWQPSVDELIDIPEVKEQLSAHQQELLVRAREFGIVGESVIDWCINNLLFLDEIQQSIDAKVYYEDLLMDSTAEVKALFRLLEIDYVDTDAATAIAQRSETTRGIHRSAEMLQSDRLHGWKTELSEAEQRLCVELLGAFNVDRLYDSNWQPRET